MHQKHRKSLPNRRQQGAAFGGAPRGAALRGDPLGFVVFHLVRIVYAFGEFPEPCWTPTGPRPPMEITAPVEITAPTSIQAFTVNGWAFAAIFNFF